MKPSIPKGTRDFSPTEMLRRKYIFSTIEKVFQKYGFLPLETPAMENLETLTGKYGEEGDRLIFKVLNSGKLEQYLDVEELRDDFFKLIERGKEVLQEELLPGSMLAIETDQAIREFLDIESLTEKALRYDLTVPFARYVVQHQNELAFPFKRYQIQPVWRADRPQKGRYREFYQCDADVIGSTSLLNEVELVLLIREVFQALGLPVAIHINNRKVLKGFADMFGIPDRLIEFVTILDKLDKVGKEETLASYVRAGFGRAVVDGVKEMIETLDRHNGTFESHRDLEKLFAKGGAAAGTLGIMEIEQVLNGVNQVIGDKENYNIVVDFTLARGLDYYTGAIFEVKAAEGTLQSSICGGGRYDDLTGIFGLKNMSGVGISFGADRIYDVLLEMNKFPAELGSSTKLLFANFGENEALHCLKLLRQVRDAGIAAELYPDQAKLPKQFTYAEKKGIPYVAIVGESEMSEGKVTLKKMGANEKGNAMSIEEVIKQLSVVG